MIISLHLPKTAGTSFKKVLSENLRGNVLFDYGDQIVDQTKRAQARRAEREREATKLHGRYTNHLSIIHGHFYLKKYKFLHPCSNHYVTVLREPSAMLMSYYNYLQNKPGTSTLQRIVKPLSFSEFVSHPWFQNIFSSLICGVSPRQFSLIGFQDSFSQFVRVFADKFLDGLPLSVPTENLGNYASNQLEPDTIRLIKRLNLADYDFYNASRDLFSKFFDRSST